ncbi:MAG: methyltransferase domain-containing protein [Deltaproteobacteria bacterium]|nr:methyltransferase domain-containing protein [Deltaproteobacteria bacterium]
MAQRDQYFLGQSLAEQERLRRQAEELAEDANFLFDRIAIAPGSRIVELGCGPRGCLDILSRRVGCQGSVVGIEIDPEAAARARQYLADQNIENVEVRQGDGKATGPSA